MLQKGLRKLSCRWRYGPRLSAYLDHELSGEAAKATANHVSNCASCRVELEQLRFANRALVEFEMPMMRAPIVTGNVFRLLQPKKVSFFKRLCAQRIAIPVPLAVGLSLALIGTISIFVWSETSNQPAVEITAAPAVVVEFVKVPVDRVVTRTVYVKQPASRRAPVSSEMKVRQSISADSNESLAHNNSRSGEWFHNGLKDFRPAPNANFRVIKEQEE